MFVDSRLAIGFEMQQHILEVNMWEGKGRDRPNGNVIGQWNLEEQKLVITSAMKIVVTWIKQLIKWVNSETGLASIR